MKTISQLIIEYWQEMRAKAQERKDEKTEARLNKLLEKNK